ncbi:hypothetical protein GGR58DRAFT_474917 [Xylaria digitata]|nr:hypothetical protein GGR58DRAFT_474917 [Xylaria digitata]
MAYRLSHLKSGLQQFGLISLLVSLTAGKSWKFRFRFHLVYSVFTSFPYILSIISQACLGRDIYIEQSLYSMPWSLRCFLGTC